MPCYGGNLGNINQWSSWVEVTVKNRQHVECVKKVLHVDSLGFVSAQREVVYMVEVYY